LLRDSAPGAWSRLKRGTGQVLLGLAPKLMHFLAIAGTAAMFLVGGSILSHGLPVLHHWLDNLQRLCAAVPAAGPVLAAIAPLLLDLLVGIAVGALVLAAVSAATALRRMPWRR
nr:DUF808 family protein [Pseudomonadales bacterium]